MGGKNIDTWHYPSQSELEWPLLISIDKRGGAIWFSIDGDDIEAELADKFHLSREQRDRTSMGINGKGKRCWRNHIQQVRRKLVAKGELLKPSAGDCAKDRWQISDAGYRRMGTNSPQKRPAQIT